MSLFLGFLKAIAETLMPRKKYRHNSRDSQDKPDKSCWDLDTEPPDPDDNRSMKWWQERLEEKVQQDEMQKTQAEKQMIEDYEFRHKDDRESKQLDNEATKEGERINNESDSNRKVNGKESAESEIVKEEAEDTSSDQDAAETKQNNSSDIDDFHADVGIEIDEEF